MGDSKFFNLSWDTLTSNKFVEDHLNEVVHELNMIKHVREPTKFHIIPDLCLSPDEDSILNVGVKGHFFLRVIIHMLF